MAEVFAITKLVVGDVEDTVRFYGDLCGLKEARRIEGEFEGRRIIEVIMAAESAIGGTLVLVAYPGQPAPAPGECVLVFETGDLDTFVARAVKAGGSIQTPARKLPDLDLAYAYVRDPEGHVVEGLQRGLKP